MRPDTDSLSPPFDEVTASWGRQSFPDPEAVQRWQLDRAWQVVERASADNPFYRSRLRLPETPDAEGFRLLPFTRKDDVVADCTETPPYGSRTVCRPEDVAHVVETSGTSGRGREVYALDASDERAVFEAEAVGFWWAGVRPGTPVLLCLPLTIQAAGKWYYGGLNLLGANVLPVGSYPTERKISTLLAYEGEVIVSTPSYVSRLTAELQRSGLDPAADTKVRSILVAGEPYGEDWARRMEAIWGAALFEQYGCTERAIAWACPPGVVGKEPGRGLRTLHFPPEIGYCEVIDRDTGEHVGDGEWGELVVTALAANASPLIRFATGDRVRYVAPDGCDCGRPLGGISAGAVYRFDDMMKVRGTNLWPGALDSLILGAPGVIDYRGVVRHGAHHSELIEIRVEVEDMSRPVDQTIHDLLRERYNLSATVDLVPSGEISNKRSDQTFVKVRRWSDERDLSK